MDVNILSCEELTYELGIRNMTLSATLLEKRKILKLLLQQEEELKLPAGKSIQFNIPFELRICSDKLNQIDTEIQNVTSINIHTKFKQCATRLCHVENRLRRLNMPDQKNLQLLKELCSVLLDIMENALEIDEAIQIYKKQNFIDNVLVKVISKAAEKKPIVEHDLTNSNSLPNIIMDDSMLEACPKNTDLDFFKIDIPSSDNVSICYNGITNVKDFKNLIEMLRIIHNVSKEQLLASASVFLQDDALLWYKARKHIFRDWDFLISELVRSFSTGGKDETIWKRVNNRFQRENEQLVFYISCMEHLLQRLACPPNEQDRVKIIKRNLLAPIKAALIYHEIYTVEQLLKIGRSVENCYWAQNRYHF